MTQTVSAYALAHGHDRRTLKRRLLAAGIKPVETMGRAEYYRVQDLQSLMVNPDDASGLSDMDRDSQTLVYAFGFLSERFPDCMDSALLHTKISAQKRDLLTLRFWAALAQCVVNVLPPPPDGLGTVPVIHATAIKEVAAGLGITLDDETFDSLLK